MRYEFEVFTCSEKDYAGLLKYYGSIGYALVTAIPHPHGGATLFMQRLVG